MNSNETLFSQRIRRLSWKVFAGALLLLLWVTQWTTAAHLSVNPATDWPEWRGRLEPVLAQATRPYGYARAAFPRVMLARMAPGGVIHPHVDANPAAKWPHKIHVPLLTNPQVGFLIGERVYHFPEGRAVEVNNLGRHAVRNDGATDRIHLIFEYFDEDQPAPPPIV